MHGVIPYRRRSWPPRDEALNEYVVGIAFVALPFFVLTVVTMIEWLGGPEVPFMAMAFRDLAQIPSP